MLAEHLLNILKTAFPADDVVELVGPPPGVKDQKVTIILNCAEGVDPTVRQIQDQRKPTVAVEITVVGRNFATEDYSVRNKTREILYLLDIKNMSKEQLKFTDDTNNYTIAQMNPTAQAYGLLDESTYSSEMTFNNIYLQT